MWQAVRALVEKHQRFLITTHVNPDGDAIGSSMALASYLHDIGKQATVVTSSHTPRSCRFLDPDDTIRVYPDTYEPSMLEEAEAVIVVDVNNWGQLGPFGDVLRQSSLPRVCIDHHESVEDGFADVVASDTSAAAAGVLVYEFLREMDYTPTPQIRDAIYTAVMTDTGSFRFSNTDVRVMRIATDLIERGASPFELHQLAFAKTLGAVKLLGLALTTMGTEASGKLVWLQVTQQMLRQADASYEDSDGIIDVVRAMEGVEFVLFFKETPNSRVKVSLRSNGKVDVHAIAKRYGGGGHRMASGMTLDGPVDKAIARVVADCKVTESVLADDA